MGLQERLSQRLGLQERLSQRSQRHGCSTLSWLVQIITLKLLCRRSWKKRSATSGHLLNGTSCTYRYFAAVHNLAARGTAGSDTELRVAKLARRQRDRVPP